MGLAPIGSLLGGFVGQDWGLRASLLATVAGMMLSPAIIVFSPLARLGRALPAQATPTAPAEPTSSQ
jgi:hypothetical protein